MAKTIERTALVEQSAEQMFALVNDIENYPRFMEGCVGAELLEISERQVMARLDIRKGRFAHSFITRNSLHPCRKIDLQLVDGPFQQLEGQWQFTPIGDLGCRVSLSLTFEFKSRLIAVAGNPWIESMGNKLVDAVCQRAREIYA